jgi:hypothetical protein
MRGVMRKLPTRTNRKSTRRAGAAALDYGLVLGVILPMIGFVLGIAPKIVTLVYEMVRMLVAWPFM